MRVGESGGGQETWSAEQSVGFHPYGQPVGWWASSRVSVIPSFTTHDCQIITHTQAECTLCEKADANDVGCVYECVALDRCTRCPLSTPVAFVTNMLRYRGGGDGGQMADTETSMSGAGCIHLAGDPGKQLAQQP